MKPLSSFFGLRLQTAVKIACKSFVLLVMLTLTINVYALDYEGPRQESLMALLVCLVFLVLLTGSAFTGHSGAYRESICLVATSLCLLCLAILHWLIIGVISMQKNDSETMWNVCIQERCPETLWTLNFGYRIIKKEEIKNIKLLPRLIRLPFDSKVNFELLSQPEVSKFIPGESLKQIQFSDFNKNVVNKRRKEYIRYGESEDNEYGEVNIETVVTFQPRNFWERMTTQDTESTDPATGLSLLVTLLFFLMGFIYFFTSATILCSYCAELYEELRAEEEEEEDSEEKDNAELSL